jgi:sigma-B regulation protein RsbU (phosphoserine phosphatase)
MFISAFYGVVDRTRGELLYANTGHPHAFVVGPDGKCERLTATDPPLGMASAQPATTRRAWDPDKDLLVLFTDGLSDARNRAGERLGEGALLEVLSRYRDEEPAEILTRLIDLVEAHSGDTPRRDDQTIVLLRS